MSKLYVNFFNVKKNNKQKRDEDVLLSNFLKRHQETEISPTFTSMVCCINYNHNKKLNFSNTKGFHSNAFITHFFYI